MIRSTLNNRILNLITRIDDNRRSVSSVRIPVSISDRLRKNSKKRSAYSSNRIEGNPLTQEQADEVIEHDERKHLLKPEQEIRNYYLALNHLERMAVEGTGFSEQLILDVQRFVEKGASKEKIGLRGPMPPGVLFAVYDSQTGTPEYIPPEYKDIPELLEELVDYVNTTDDHPLIVAAIVHYQIVTIHPFEDGNGRTARLLSGYILDVNGYGFNGIGSLEEYFAYDVGEYYASIQMGLPASFYSGRNEPPHPEIWIEYFLRMVLLYSERVREISQESSDDAVMGSLSHLGSREREFLLFLLDRYDGEFTPIEVSRLLGISNRMVINRLSILARNGLVTPHVAKERIMSYELSDFTKDNREAIIRDLERTMPPR